MEKVEIVFTKSRKFLPVFSWLVRLWTWKPYSHVALKFNPYDLDKPVYFQSNEGKVNFEYECHFLKEHQIVRSIEISLTIEQYRKLLKATWEQAGSNYGLLQNLGIVLVDILRLLGITATNPWKQGRNCSELIYELIVKNIYGDQSYRVDLVKPHHIERILKELQNR